MLNIPSSNIFEISRLSNNITHGWTAGITSALAFQVDSKIQLCGIGIFGSSVDKENLAVDIKVLDGNGCLLEESKTFKSLGSYSPIKLIFTNPVQIEASKKYHITAKNSGGKFYYGVNLKTNVDFDDVNADPVKLKVTFSGSRHDTNNYVQTGIIPTIYFSKLY